MSEDQKEPCEQDESCTESSEDAAETAEECEETCDDTCEEEGKAAPEEAPSQPLSAPATPLSPRKSSPAGFLVCFIVGVVVGVLAYGTVDRSTETERPVVTTYEPQEYDYSGEEGAGAGESTPSPAITGALQAQLADAVEKSSEVLDQLSAKNYGKAGDAVEALSVSLTRAKSLAGSTEQQDLLETLITNAETLQESVDGVADDAVDRAQDLKDDLKEAVEGMD